MFITDEIIKHIADETNRSAMQAETLEKDLVALNISLGYCFLQECNHALHISRIRKAHLGLQQ